MSDDSILTSLGLATGLTEEQFLEALENEEDLGEVIAKKRGRKAMRTANKLKRMTHFNEDDQDDDQDEEEEDEEDEDFMGGSGSRGRKLGRTNSSNIASHSPEPNRKRKRLFAGGAQIDGSVDGDEERGNRKVRTSLFHFYVNQRV